MISMLRSTTVLSQTA